jgi:hypothetical protein
MSNAKRISIPAECGRWLRRAWNAGLLVIAAFGAASCASIPAEAPQLSAELGKRIAAIEHSHLTMLHRFMDDRRARVDEFIQKEWIPVFARNLFEDTELTNVWNQVVASTDPNDRMKFLGLVAPRMQKKINAKRLELMAPLDEIERAIERHLRDEYEQALGVNNAITSFLHSAADLAANQERYMAMAQNALGINVDFEAQLN